MLIGDRHNDFVVVMQIVDLTGSFIADVKVFAASADQSTNFPEYRGVTIATEVEDQCTNFVVIGLYLN